MIVATLRARVADEASMNDMLKDFAERNAQLRPRRPFSKSA